MSLPPAHIQQACRNLDFLNEVNKLSETWDWKVTISFYVAVHIVNSHLAHSGLHYRSHADVSHAINPSNSLSVTKLPEKVYVSYQKLHGLSRRARYLVHDDPEKKGEECHLTFDKHFEKAVKNLDNILAYFIPKYSFKVPEVRIKCLGLKAGDLSVLKVIP